VLLVSETESQNLRDVSILHDEIHLAMLADQSRLGDVYRCLSRSMSDVEIQAELGLATVGTIGHIKRSVRAIRDGWNPPGLGPATQAKNSLGRLLRNFNFSEGVRADLVRRLEELEANVRLIQDRRLGTPIPALVSGVYVWTINTYLEDEDERGLIWFRIGQSDDITQRMRQHRQDVKLPEPLILARVYSHPTLVPDALERQFHGLCVAAVHERARVNNRDREWFRTTLELLDFFAEQIGCRSHSEMVEEDL
jgi:hypothetical protein